MSGIISVNGKITAAAEAVMSPLDRGFLYGDNIFETFVAFHDKILDVSEHLERMVISAQQAGILLPLSLPELEFELQTLVEQAQFAKSWLRLVITRGTGIGLSVKASLTPNRLIYCFPALDTGPAALKLKSQRLSRYSRSSAIKSGNYLNEIIALSHLQTEGDFDDILWFNEREEFTELSTANVFFVNREGENIRITTPPSSVGLLEGITRKNLLRLMQKAKLPIFEEVAYVDELAKFDEAFACSTVRGLIPIDKIDHHQLATTRKDSVFHQIQRLYLAWVYNQTGFTFAWSSGKKISPSQA